MSDGHRLRGRVVHLGVPFAVSRPRRQREPVRAAALDGLTPAEAAALEELTQIARIDALARERHGMTLKEIGDELGRSRERIRQIEAQALRKLRARMRPGWRLERTTKGHEK